MVDQAPHGSLKFLWSENIRTHDRFHMFVRDVLYPLGRCVG